MKNPSSRYSLLRETQSRPFPRDAEPSDRAQLRGHVRPAEIFQHWFGTAATVHGNGATNSSQSQTGLNQIVVRHRSKAKKPVRSVSLPRYVTPSESAGPGNQRRRKMAADIQSAQVPEASDPAKRKSNLACSGLAGNRIAALA